jgi:arylformamidase
MLYRSFATQAEIDAEYSPRLAVGEAQAEAYLTRYAEESARVRREIAGTLDMAYGPSPAETLDIFPAPQVDAPVHVFIHGGYWRAFTSKEFSFVAEPFHRAGVTAVIVNYALCPEVTIDEIVRQCRAALIWTARNASSFGGDIGRITISGHSAGGHLTAMMLATDWAALGLGATPIRAACAISGLFDLGPFPHSFLQPSLHLDDAQVARNSPLFLPPRAQVPVVVAVGGEESQEFHRQSRDYGDHLAKAGIPADYVDLPGRNHFTVLDDLTGTGGALFEILLKQIREQPPNDKSDMQSSGGAGRLHAMPLNTLTILVVEDQSDLRSLLGELLLDAGYNVISVRTADDALPILESDRPIDLLFTDIVMPGRLNGIDLGREAARLRPDLRIIYTTAYADPELFRREGIAPEAVLRKPYLPGQVEQEINAILAPSG